MQYCIFPQELVDHTLNFLHDDPDTLQNCSLVCWAWVPACRRHIFRRVYFPPTDDTPCLRFHRLLEHTPSIIPLVRDLQMLNGGIRWDHSPGWPINSYSWVSTEESPHRVLTTLQSAGKLNAFSILLKAEWTTLPLKLRTSIRALFQLPSLTEVDLTDCDFVLILNLDVLFRHCSGLKRVKLSQITFDYRESIDKIWEDFPHAQHSDRARLECLTVLGLDASRVTSWILHPRAAVDVTGLHKLRFSIAPSHPTDIPLLEKFLGIIGSSLEHLHLELAYCLIDNATPCIDVNQQHLLRSVRLSCLITRYCELLDWVIKFFSQITPDSIHEIVIDLQLESENNHFPREDFISLPWDDLDVALNSSAFGLLQQVDVTVSWSWIRPKTPWALDDVKALLPRLASRGILRVYEPVHEHDWFYKWPGPTWHSWS